MKYKRETPLLSLSRAKILSLIAEKPRSIAQLVKDTKLSRTTIYSHLERLKKNNLITEEKQTNEQGQPVLIVTNKASPINLKLIEALQKAEALFKK